jgi:hypothetical protein
MTTITLQDSCFDGTRAAQKAWDARLLQPEHFTNPGADYWGDEGCTWLNAAQVAYVSTDDKGFLCRHVRYVDRCHQEWLDRGERGSFPTLDSEHEEAFIDGFETEAKRQAYIEGWEVQS